MHKIKPNQKVTIIQIEIAVPTNASDIGEIEDEVHAILENSVANKDSNILDWTYTGNIREVTASNTIEEGSIFSENVSFNLPNGYPNNILYEDFRSLVGEMIYPIEVSIPEDDIPI